MAQWAASLAASLAASNPAPLSQVDLVDFQVDFQVDLVLVLPSAAAVALSTCQQQMMAAMMTLQLR